MDPLTDLIDAGNHAELVILIKLISDPFVLGSALCYACAQSNVAITQTIFYHMPLSLNFYFHALLSAIKHQNMSAYAFLLIREPRLLTSYTTEILYAIIDSKSEYMLRVLIIMGLDPDVKLTAEPLLICCIKADVGIGCLQVLFAAGVDTRVTDASGRTIPHLLKMYRVSNALAVQLYMDGTLDVSYYKWLQTQLRQSWAALVAQIYELDRYDATTRLGLLPSDIRLHCIAPYLGHI